MVRLPIRSTCTVGNGIFPHWRNIFPQLKKKQALRKEELNLTTRYNEYIMTSLRTRRGIDLPTLITCLGQELSDYCTSMAVPYLKSNKLEQQDNHLRLTREGIFVSDGIISDLMFVEE